MNIIIRIYVCICFPWDRNICMDWPKTDSTHDSIRWYFIYINLSANIVINNLDTGLQNTYNIFLHAGSLYCSENRHNCVILTVKWKQFKGYKLTGSDGILILIYVHYIFNHISVNLFTLFSFNNVFKVVRVLKRVLQKSGMEGPFKYPYRSKSHILV